jgi:two-component system response regulator CssR
MYKVYLLEDEVNLNNIIKAYLEKEGYEVKSFKLGNDAIEAVEDNPHLWVLDIMLPDISGFDVLTEIRKHDEDLPVIFMSARDSDIDRILGLEMGSDDYISKPFSPKELVIRVNKLIKRIYDNKPGAQLTTYNSYSIDVEKRLVFEDKKEMNLTSKEFDLLLLMIRNPGHAFSREKILTAIWDENYFGSDRVVDDLVRRLRKKMPRLNLETIYGFGYRLND